MEGRDKRCSDTSSDEESLLGQHWMNALEEFPVEREDHEDDADDFQETRVLDPTWITSFREKCFALEPTKIKACSKNTSIHRVPQILFQEDNNAYVPQVISIGPLHYGKRGGQLQVTEEHKWRYMKEIIRRKEGAASENNFLKECMEAVTNMENDARKCYSEVIDLQPDSFVEMMVLDGCFIIELFRKTWAEEFEDDPIFRLGWLHRELVIDLVMLENQIPFSILEKLFHLIGIPDISLNALALKFFRRWPFFRNILRTETFPERTETLNILPERTEALPERTVTLNILPERTETSKLRIHHLLHLIHENIVLSSEEDPAEQMYPSSKASKAIQCASKLQQSGIKFKKRDLEKDAGNFLDIKFDREKGVIEIPLILLEDRTNTILRNLIAFEQCYLPCKKYIITYAFFMDCLINSSKDVEILRQKGIIKTSLGSDGDVALLFNKINKEVILFRRSFYLLGVCKEINNYCGTALPKLRATFTGILTYYYLKHRLWAILSFIAAILVLLFTMTQAFFSAFPKFAVGK